MKGTRMVHECSECGYVTVSFQGMIAHLKEEHFDNEEIKADVEKLEAHEEARYQKVWAERPAAQAQEVKGEN